MTGLADAVISASAWGLESSRPKRDGSLPDGRRTADRRSRQRRDWRDRQARAGRSGDGARFHHGVVGRPWLMAAKLLIEQDHEVVAHGRNDARRVDALRAASKAKGGVSGDLEARSVAERTNKQGMPQGCVISLLLANLDHEPVPEKRARSVLRNHGLIRSSNSPMARNGATRSPAAHGKICRPVAINPLFFSRYRLCETSGCAAWRMT